MLNKQFRSIGPPPKKGALAQLPPPNFGSKSRPLGSQNEAEDNSDEEDNDGDIRAPSGRVSRGSPKSRGGGIRGGFGGLSRPTRGRGGSKIFTYNGTGDESKGTVD